MKHQPITTNLLEKARAHGIAVIEVQPERVEPQFGQTTAHVWHQQPQARAILSRMEAVEFIEYERSALLDGLLPSYSDYSAMTEAAMKRQRRLEALRRQAITDVMGFDALGHGVPRDKALRWMNLSDAVPTVFEAMNAEFRRKAERRAA